MVHKSQICFVVKLNMLLYIHIVLVSMFIMFPIIVLRNYTVPGQNMPQTLNVKNELHVYQVYSFTVIGFNKIMNLNQYTEDT